MFFDALIPNSFSILLQDLSESGGGKKLIQLGHVAAAPATAGYSTGGGAVAILNSEEDMSQEGRLTDLKLQFVSGKL